MADLPKLERAERRIPQGGELQGTAMTARSFRAGDGMRPEGLVAAAPVMDVRGFIDEARGMTTVGEAVSGIGAATMRLASEQAAAVARRQALDVEARLGDIEIETASRIASQPDELQWGSILEEQVGKARQSITDQPMMADAKLAADEMFSKWERRHRMNVTMRQANRSFERVREGMAGKAQTLENNKDFDGAAAVWQSPDAAKYFGEDVVANQLGQLQQNREAVERRAIRDSIEGDAASSPGLWLDRNQEPGDMDPDDWQAGQAMARRVLSTRVSDAATEIGDKMATGDIKTAAELERVAAGRLGPGALEAAKNDLRKMQSEEWRAENLGEKGVTKNFGLLLSEVERYDKAADPDGSKYAGLVWRIKTTMPEELRGEITGPLSRKWNPANAPDAPEPLRGFVRETLRNWFDDGKFGQTRKRVPLTPEDSGWYQGTKEQKWVDDPPARDAAAGRRGEAEMEMSKWLKANPGASIKEAKDQLLRSSSASLKPRDVDTLLRKAPPAAPAVDVPARLKEMGLRFGGVNIPATGDLGAARTTVFGGPNDPADNGKSAFGGPTGEGGREGVAVPAKILRHFYGDNRGDWERVTVEATLPDGSKKVLPIADLGTAEWVWERDGKPVMDLTPGAVKALGGDVVYGRNGTLKGSTGLAGVKFRLLPLSDQTPPFDS